jgi:glycosyltransferase involved in cell wall biosynthesis
VRIAVFHPKFAAVGGAELLILEQAAYLREAGHEVVFHTFEVSGGAWEGLLRTWPVNLIPKRRGLDFLTSFTRSAKLKARLRRAEPLLRDFERVLATNHPCSTMLGLMEVPGRKFWYCNEAYRRIFTRETSPGGVAALERLGPANPALEALAADIRRAESSSGLLRVRREAIEGLSRIHRTFFNSRFTQENARRACGDLPGDVHPPIIRFPAPGGPRRGLDRQALRILVQTRLTPLKNVETVVAGFLAFRAAHPGAELHVVGTGPSEGGLRAMAAASAEGASVRFHGFLPGPALAELRARCQVFALLPLDEPFGMVFPEAAANGLLLIGPDHGGPVEILEEGRLGRLVPAFSPGEFRSALEALCDLRDGDVDALRDEADASCRARYGLEVLGPRLERALVEG